MFGKSLKSILRITVIVTLGLPMTSAAAWRLFLVLFSPPPAGQPLVSAHFPTPAGELTRANFEDSTQRRAADFTLDDAGRLCRANQITVAELRVETDAINFIGHAFLATPNVTLGFRTDRQDFGLIDYLNPLSRTWPGYLRDDRRSPYNFVRSYRIGPRTLGLLEASIQAHRFDSYQVGNWNGGRNCSTWARDRLIDAGLTPPSGDCPNKMAWMMTSPIARSESTVARNSQFVSKPGPGGLRKAVLR